MGFISRESLQARSAPDLPDGLSSSSPSLESNLAIQQQMQPHVTMNTMAIMAPTAIARLTRDDNPSSAGSDLLF